MARPKKYNADYFSHDADMRNDQRVKALRRKFGLIGYAIYNLILEVLTDSDYFQYEWNELNVELLAGDFDIEPEELKNIVKYSVDVLKVLDIENGYLKCNTLTKRFDSLLSKRKRDRTGVIADENPQSKVKESKGKERKVDDKEKESPTATDFSKLESIKEIHSRLKNDNTWIGVLSNYHEINQDKIIQLLDKFILFLQSKSLTMKSESDFKDHFGNWIPKQDLKKINTNPNIDPKKYHVSFHNYKCDFTKDVYEVRLYAADRNTLVNLDCLEYMKKKSIKFTEKGMYNGN